jgi:hypothetical protein
MSLRIHKVRSHSPRPCDHPIEIPTSDPRFNLCLDCRTAVPADFRLSARKGY